MRGIGPRTIGITTSGTGVWPGVGCCGRGGKACVEVTCFSDVDGTGDAVVGVADEEVMAIKGLAGGGCPQFVWVKAA